MWTGESWPPSVSPLMNKDWIQVRWCLRPPMKKFFMLLIVIPVSLSLPTWAEDKSTYFQLKGAWWQSKATVSRNTTLVATFDDKLSNNADFAMDRPEAGGFGMDTGVQGKYDLATKVGEDGAHTHYIGGSNINPNRGTIRFLARGKVWRDPKPRWLFEARSRHFIGIRRAKGELSLVMRTGQYGEKVISKLELPMQEVTTDQWHSIIASWDRSTGRAWLVFDGRGVTAEVAFPQMPWEAQVFYIGGGHNAKYGEGLMPMGLELDELAVYNVPISVLEATPMELAADDTILLMQADRGARLSYNRIYDLQRWGGWMNRYTWPTQIGSFAQGRRNIGTEADISNDKGSGTPNIAATLLYASEVLGDARYFEAARRAADLLLAAQDERGFWVPQYSMSLRGIKPLQTIEAVKLQDKVQSHPIFFLACIYRLTGEMKYLDALKRAGKFVLSAQNPNGSWSHHYNVTTGIGETRNRHPHGGELNDGAMNEGINVMVLMYHITKHRKYVQAVKRAGQWLIDAQLTGNVVGWAEQYDQYNRPVWARNFEPPAWSRKASDSASRALVEVYRLSGDDRYLKPVKAYTAYMNTYFPEGETYAYYDTESRRPIAAWMNKIYFLDNELQLALYHTFPAGNGYARMVSFNEAPDKLLLDAKLPVPQRRSPVVTRIKAARQLPKLREETINALKTQHVSGMWIEANVANFQASLGQGFGLINEQATLLLRFVEAARIARGELPPAYRGEGKLLHMAYPKDDWYDIDWDRRE